MKSILLVLLLVPTQVLALCDDWTRSHTIQEIAFQTVMFVDTRLTIDGCERVYPASEYPRCEANPIVGQRPDRATMNTVFVLTGAGHLLVSCLLPARWRTDWNVITIPLEGFAVMQWLLVGARFRF